MGTTNIYRVVYHFEINGKSAYDQHYVAWVSAAGSDYNSIKTVLNNNGKLIGGTLVIDAVHHAPSCPDGVLT